MKIEPLRDAIPYRTFLDESIVDLREEGVLKGYWLIGPSPDSCDADNLFARSEQLGKSPIHFRDGDAIQVIWDRQPATAPPVLQYAHPAAAMVHAELRERFDAQQHWVSPCRLYLSHQFEKPIKNLARELLLTTGGPQQIGSHDLLRQHALGRFQAFEDAVKGAVGLTCMANTDMFNDLLHHITYRDVPAALPEPWVRLNQVMACEWQVNGLYPMMAGWHLRPIVITLYPNETLPQTLSVLLEHPGYLTLSIRYRCLSPYQAQKNLDAEKPFWRQTVLGDFVKIIKSLFGTREDPGDDAFAQIAEINEAIDASRSGTSFGTVSCIVIVRDRDPDQADMRTHNLTGLLNGKGMLARIETIGAEKAIRSTWPGHLLMTKDQYEANRYRIKLTGFNFWDLAMPRKLWEGTPTIDSSQVPPGTPTPLVCSGTAGEPFHYPLAANGVMHFLGIGTTGSGKSTWTNAFICALLGLPNLGRIVLMDSSLAKSSFVFSHLIDAEYHEVGAKESIPLCPLALLDKEGGLQWLAGWFERLFFRRKGFELDETESKDFMNALQDVRMYKNTSPDDSKRGKGRNLLDLFAALHGGTEGRNRIRKILDEIISYYGHILGGDPVDLGNNRITVYQLSGLNGVPKYIATPAKELILYNTIANLDGSPSWVIWDEFWDAVGDDTS
ncbi:MAG: hypothetical protein JO189_31755, partial [Deltaproteobacteria bacterium]|nr:hypothetical protein [Deltaproteobacteria bacterium]